MASREQQLAADYLMRNTRWRMLRERKDDILLRCTDPNIRLRIGKEKVWRQKCIISRENATWFDEVPLKVGTRKMAERMMRSNIE